RMTKVIKGEFEKLEDVKERSVSHEVDDDIGYNPSDVAFIEWLRGDDEVELADEESFNSDSEDDVADVFMIDTNIFDYETPLSLEDSELKEEALRNKAIEEGLIKEEDDDESFEEREELCEVHKLLVCNIRRFEMIKYSFGQDEEYVAIKEDEYDDLARTSEDACPTYQEIFRMMDEGWIITRVE
ncbi:hypothetical protein Tco_1095290, partial [Tanacetum coccineum]